MTFLHTICQDLGIPLTYEMNFQVAKYCVDSRQVNSGDLFCALKGVKVDGHHYLSDVAKKGAIAAIVDKNYLGDTYGLHLIKVVNPLNAVQTLAKKKIQRTCAEVIAITGSVGKTTTKLFLSDLLRARCNVMATPGNQNSQIGLPLAILNLVSGNERYLVLEMGMSKEGEMRNLVNIAPPDIALITHIDKVHIANFESIDDIIHEKGVILSHPKTKLGVVPADILGLNTFMKMGTCKKKTYCFKSSLGEKVLSDDRNPLSQRHIRKNLLAAMTVMEYLGYDYEDVAKSFSNLKMPEMRQTILKKKGIAFINDAYNACVSSTKAAIDCLPEAERRVAVLGGMAELGKFCQSSHQEIGEYTLGKFDKVFCLGDECLPIVACREEASEAVEHFDDLNALSLSLKKYLLEGDLVLIKGSFSKEMWKVIDQV